MSPTERRNPATLDIDLLPTVSLLRVINTADAGVPGAVAEALPQLAELVDRTVAAVRAGGRIHYFGAGSSGRVGVMDAAEVQPTYGAHPELFQAHLAGGAVAMTDAVEDAEDSSRAGREEAEATVRPGDVVIGIAASGRTPYVAGALEHARATGCTTAVVTANPEAALADVADLHICVDTGPEVVTGSTRMRAGTAQKLVLHTLSTAVMVRLGHTYSNLMVGVVPTNAKLRERVIRILVAGAETSPEQARAALDAAGGDTRLALLALLSGAEPADGAAALAAAEGSVRRALQVVARSAPAVSGDAAAGHLGIDVGASGFRMTLAGVPGQALTARSTARPTVTAAGLDLGAMLPELHRRSLDLVAQAGAARPLTIGIGVAGGYFWADRLTRFAEEIALLQRDVPVTCFPDTVGVYVGAVGVGPGAVLAAGTGAVAVATDGAGEWRQVDGLGHLLGDRGSGAWIGQRGLRAALAHADGREGGSEALGALVDSSRPARGELVRSIHQSPDRAARLASYAPTVLDAAADGDPASAVIVEEAAELLTDTLALAADGITRTVVAVGGLMEHDLLAGLVRRNLATRGLQVATALGAPVDGAAVVGRLAAEHQLPEALRGLCHTTSGRTFVS